MRASLRVPGFDELGFGDALTANDRAAVGANALLRGLADAPLLALIATFRVVTLPRETLLYVRGQRAQRVFLILHGSVALVRRTGPVRTPIAVLADGTFSGEGALLTPRVRHPWTASCLDETRIAFADGAALRAAIATLPSVGYNVALALHERVQDAARAIGALSESR